MSITATVWISDLAKSAPSPRLQGGRLCLSAAHMQMAFADTMDIFCAFCILILPCRHSNYKPRTHRSTHLWELRKACQNCPLWRHDALHLPVPIAHGHSPRGQHATSCPSIMCPPIASVSLGLQEQRQPERIQTHTESSSHRGHKALSSSNSSNRATCDLPVAASTIRSGHTIRTAALCDGQRPMRLCQTHLLQLGL